PPGVSLGINVISPTRITKDEALRILRPAALAKSALSFSLGILDSVHIHFLAFGQRIRLTAHNDSQCVKSVWEAVLVIQNLTTQNNRAEAVDLCPLLRSVQVNVGESTGFSDISDKTNLISLKAI